MATFTRKELRTRQQDTANFTGVRTFELVNNGSANSYFNIEGVNGKDIFNTASITNLVNCTVVTESIHAGFIINSGSTANFDFTPSATLLKEEVEFIASNSEVFSVGDITSSGSYIGVDLDTKA